MARAHFVKRARKCPQRGSGIYKGDSYWWWAFKYGPKIVSKTRPSRAQLTRSPFYKTVYALEDGVAKLTSAQGAELYVDEMRDEIEQLRSECEESLEALPENLREASSSGILLQERIEGLSEWLANLANMDWSEHVESEPDEDGEDSEMVDVTAVIQAIQDCNPGSF